MEKLLKVCTINRKTRVLFLNQSIHHADFALRSYSDGAIALRPLFSSPIDQTSNIGVTALVDYLANLLGTQAETSIYKSICEIANYQAISKSTKKLENESKVLFSMGEAFLASLSSKRNIPENAKMHASEYADKKQRLQLWRSIWKTVSRQSNSVTNARTYHGGHSELIIIPQHIWQGAMLSAKEQMSLVERDDGTYLLRRTQENETKYVYRKEPITRDGTVRNGRYLYLTKSQKAALHIDASKQYQTGVMLKFTFDLNETHSITIEPLSPEEANTLPTMPNHASSAYYDTKRIVQRNVKDAIILPTEFCRRYHIQKDDFIGSETFPDKVIFYGHKDICSICGTEHEYKDMKTITLCPDCADALAATHEAVMANGGIPATATAVKANLAAAMKKIEALEEV